jgi:hypothetical protein
MALIDTGAPRSIFSRGSAELLGIEMPDLPEDWPDYDFKELRLMGATFKGVSHTVTLCLPPYEDLTWEAEVDFIVQGDISFGLLGCEGFLNRWAVSFNGYKAYTVVEPLEDLEQRVPVDVFELWQRLYPDYN